MFCWRRRCWFIRSSIRFKPFSWTYGAAIVGKIELFIAGNRDGNDGYLARFSFFGISILLGTGVWCSPEVCLFKLTPEIGRGLAT
jgi:hypothetical protein